MMLSELNAQGIDVSDIIEIGNKVYKFKTLFRDDDGDIQWMEYVSSNGEKIVIWND